MELVKSIHHARVENATATEHVEHVAKAPEHIGVAVGKHQWDDRTGSGADKDVKCEHINTYSWSDGRVDGEHYTSRTTLEWL